MAIKVGTEDKKKVYLASGPRRGHAHPAGALSVADVRSFSRRANGSAPGGDRGRDRAPTIGETPQENSDCAGVCSPGVKGRRLGLA